MDLNVIPKVVRYRDVTSTSRKNAISKNRKPSRMRSKAHLAVRSNGVPPFTAWVETEKNFEHHRAMRNAQCEEKRLNEIIKAKEDKLKEFQQEVRKRVKDLELRKRQEQLGKSYEAVEMEQNIIHQSSFSRKLTLPTRDTCVYRDGSDLTIRGTSGSVVHDPTAVDRASKLLDEHASKIQKCSRHAREILSSKCAPLDIEKISELPGGRWKGSPTRDHLYGAVRGHTEDAPSNQGMIRQDFESTNQQRDRISIQDQEPQINDPLSVGGDFWVGQDEIKDMSFTELESHHCKKLDNANSVQCEFVNTDFKGEHGSAPVIRRKVHFEDQIQLQANKDIAVKSSVKQKATKQLTALSNLIKPGQCQEEMKKRTKCQMAVYRKLFMDLEREQVRENIRMKKHRYKMEQLKVEKEIERLTIEHQERTALANEKNGVLADNEMNENNLELKEAKIRNRFSVREQREKEMERYIDALRAVLKERLQQKRVKLPPLCSCGSTVWDANPETCANNCIFYKNPKCYAKALSSLLATCE